MIDWSQGLQDLLNNLTGGIVMTGGPGKSTETRYEGGVLSKIPQAISDYLGRISSSTGQAPNQVQGATVPTVTPTQAPTPTPTNAPGQEYIPGYSNGQVPTDFSTLVNQASEKTGINPALLAAILMQESGFNPTAHVGNDYGSAQINLGYHPEVTQEQAYDPSFAVPWMADYIAESLAKFGDINRAVASYNVGPGGANIKGPEPFGGGPRGQDYINRVAKNLTPEMIQQLGLILSGGE